MLTAPAMVGRVISSSMSAPNDSYYLVSVVYIIMFIISSKSLCRTKQSDVYIPGIGGGSILNVRGLRCKRIRAQNFKPRPLISGNAFVKIKKQRWTTGKKTVDFKESSNETSIFLTQN